MTLEQLRIFVAVAEREHVTRAAQALNLTQSAVSANISTLEDRHDVRLFQRVGRGIELTETGRAFLIEARAVLARAEEAMRMLEDFSGLEKGRIALVASQTIAGYWLPPVLARFRAKYPGVEISLSIGNSEQAATMVREGRAELGFIEGPIDDPALSHWQVGEDRLVLVGADAPPRIDPKALTNLPWVMREEGSGTRAALIEALAGHGIGIDDIDIRLTLPSNEAVLSAVASGAGLALLSTLVAGPMIEARLCRVTPFDLPPRPFYALRHKERYRTKTAEALLALLSGDRP